MPVLSLFTIEIKPEGEQEFLKDLREILPIANQAKGLLSSEMFTSSDNKYKYLFVTEWENEEDIQAWLIQPDHKKLIVKSKQTYQVRHTRRRFLQIPKKK
ncbi:MAG: antibiotic biosynthesis monooxygenase [Planctomycetes bacterium]|nr:antibiotic biosynthesis monooxygenase [Planctomycetota bacterium]